MVATYRNLCSIGEGLTLRDLGRGNEASTVFAAVAQDYPNFAPELTTLAEER